MPRPHVKMAELDIHGPVPAQVEQLAQLATNFVIDDVVEGRVSYLILLTFKGTKARLWQLHDPPAPDDIVRAIAQREEAEAIAFVYPLPLPPGVEGDRGYNVAVEAPGGKFDTLIALRGGDGLGGESMRIYARNLTQMRHHWLGVPPVGEVEMWFEGVVGAIGETGEA